MRGDTQVVVGIALVIAGAVFGHLLAAKSFPDFSTWQDAIASLGGAFAGAWIAFSLEDHRRKREERRTRVESGNRILLDLLHVWLDLHDYQKQALKRLDALPENSHWANLLPLLRPQPRSDLLDASRLEFMLGSDGSGLVADVPIYKTRYETFVFLLQRHTELHTNYAQPRFFAAGITPQTTMPLQQAIDAVGPPLYHQLKDLVSSIKDFTKRDRVECAGLFLRLRTWLRANFPGEKFIDYLDEEFKSDCNTTQTTNTTS